MSKSGWFFSVRVSRGCCRFRLFPSSLLFLLCMLKPSILAFLLAFFLYCVNVLAFCLSFLLAFVLVFLLVCGCGVVLSLCSFYLFCVLCFFFHFKARLGTCSGLADHGFVAGAPASITSKGVLTLDLHRVKVCLGIFSTLADTI